MCVSHLQSILRWTGKSVKQIDPTRDSSSAPNVNCICNCVWLTHCVYRVSPSPHDLREKRSQQHTPRPSASLICKKLLLLHSIQLALSSLPLSLKSKVRYLHVTSLCVFVSLCPRFILLFACKSIYVNKLHLTFLLICLFQFTQAHRLLILGGLRRASCGFIWPFSL